MSFATISGTLIDSDTTPWINAVWSAVAVSPSSPPVYSNGSPVLPVFGQLDSSGDFSGSIPRTDSIVPDGTTLAITIYSVTSAPPSVITNVKVSTSTLDLGSLLSPLITAPRIQSGPVVYAYTEGELLNPTHGDGYVNTTNELAYVRAGDLWQAINSGPLVQIYPPLGVAVSTGSSWGPSIPAANVALLNASTALFQGNLSAGTGQLSLTANSTSGTSVIDSDTQGALHINPAQGPILLSWDSGSGVNFGDGEGNLVGQIDTAGNLNVAGSITGSQGNFGINGGVLSLRANPTSPPTHITASTDGSIFIDPNVGPIFLSWNSGSGVNFGDGHGNLVGQLDTAGTFFAVTKNFRIQHPHDETKWLIHSALEGPEIAVFYRGEASTIEGKVEIVLPDYFEDLTRSEGRTVLLTPIYDGENDIGTLATSKVEEGIFTVFSTGNLEQAFFWEVKAVRFDVSLLEVATLRT